MRRTLSVGLSLVLFALLIPAAPTPTARAQGGDVDFTRFVAVGDSLSAGFQSGALYDGESAPTAENSGQRHSFVVLLADAMATPVVIPRVSVPGAGTLFVRNGTGCTVANITMVPAAAFTRLNPTEPATNVAVPGHSIVEANTVTWEIDPTDLSTINTLEDLILGLPDALAGAPPSTQVQTAVRRQPTFLSFWLGSNDALGAAQTANPSALTPLAEFEANADAVFEQLVATGAKGVVANVPDVSVVAFLVSQAEIKALAQGAFDDAQLQLLLGIKRTDFVPLSALPRVVQIFTDPTTGPLTANEILTKKERKLIRKAIKKYNKKLAALAEANDWAFVDINALLNDVDANGFAVPGGPTLTTNFLGGVFSLDGIHPTNTGHAVVASAFITAINAKYGTSLPLPDIAAIAAADPNICAATAKQGLTLDAVERLAPIWKAAGAILARGRRAQ
jgi:phospholipase/lecithinase/hemolysin